MRAGRSGSLRPARGSGALRARRESEADGASEIRWYHAANETPQHEVSLRDYADANVLIQDADTGAVLGELNKFDAPPILHPEAIYMHHGDTYRVLSLDLERNLALVKRVEVDYYTQALGGTDVHHIDHRLREKPFGAGAAYWGEVTAYFVTWAYREDPLLFARRHLASTSSTCPRFQLETMAFWIVPPPEHYGAVRHAGPGCALRPARDRLRARACCCRSS